MASMHPSAERRMLMRYATARDDTSSGPQMAFGLCMVVLLVMLVVGAAYYYASYRLETQHYNLLAPVA